MKTHLLTLLITIIAVVCPTASYADDQITTTIGGVIYEYTTSGYATARAAAGAQGSIRIQEKVTFTINGEKQTVTVKKVGRFTNNTEITYITLPNTIEEIGSGAFQGCTKLCSGSMSTFTIPASVKKIAGNIFAYSGVYSVAYNSSADISKCTFQDCKNLTTVTLNANIKKIGLSAFQGCTALTKIELPNNCAEIGEGAFKYCTALQTVTFKNQLKSIGKEAFSGCTALTGLRFGEGYDGLTFGDKAFAGCSGMTSIVFLKNNNISFGNETFSGLTNLERLELAEGIVSLGTGNFNGCTKLKDFVLSGATLGKTPNLPSTISNISNCFNECSSITEVDLPAPGKNMFVVESSFNYCEKLALVTEAPDMTEFYDYNGSIKNSKGLVEVRPRKSTSRSISRSGGARKISNGAFNNCPNLENLEGSFILGEGGGLFNCTKLVFEEYTLPYTEEVPSYGVPGYVKKAILKNTVRVLHANAIANIDEFNMPDSLRVMHENCINLPAATELTLPDSISDVYMGALNNCPKLQKLTVLNPIPPTISKDKYNRYRSIANNDRYVALYVPNGSGEAYRNADGWKSFKEIIELDKSEIESLEGDGEVSIKVTDGRLNVTGYDRVSVYNMLGSEVYAGHPDGIGRVAPGIYIVRAGNATAKVAL